MKKDDKRQGNVPFWVRTGAPRVLVPINDNAVEVDIFEFTGFDVWRVTGNKWRETWNSSHTPHRTLWRTKRTFDSNLAALLNLHYDSLPYIYTNTKQREYKIQRGRARFRGTLRSDVFCLLSYFLLSICLISYISYIIMQMQRCKSIFKKVKICRLKEFSIWQITLI